MNIGIDIRPLLSLVRTGVGEYTYEFLNAIFKFDKQNQYYLFYPQNIGQNLPNWDYSNVHFSPTNWPNKNLNIFQKILRQPKLDELIIKRDITNLNSKNSIDYFFSPNLNFTSISKRVKFILTIHDLSFEIFPNFFSAKQRCWHKIVNPKKQCKRADIIITPSMNTKKDIMDYYHLPAEKIKVFYPGISSVFFNSACLAKNETNEICKKYSLPPNFILFLGTIEPRKNIFGLIEAYEQAYPLLSTPHSLVIAGANGWHTKKIFERAAKSPYKENIKFVGYVEAKDKSALYSTASLFVYPSFYEGFGFPVLEAMSCGTPVITSNRSSLTEVTENAAYLVNPNKPTEIAAAIIKMLNEEKLKKYFITKGMEQAKKFNWEKTFNEWQHLISNNK